MEKVFDVVKLEARKMLSMWSAAQVELMFGALFGDMLRHIENLQLQASHLEHLLIKSSVNN